MRTEGTSLRLSATDLANHLGCRHLTQLDLAKAEGRLEPPVWQDPVLDLLKERGLQHEEAFTEHLRGQGLTVYDLRETDTDESAKKECIAAMHEGVDIIVQARLRDGRWVGIADFLRKVARPSKLGAWSYEVIDTKLARNTRAGTILQLCLYSELVEKIQGLMPEHMHVVKPGEGFEQETYRCDDFLAYFRLVRDRLLDTTNRSPDNTTTTSTTYPDPVPQCDICRWWQHCDSQRRADDHLSLVAGMQTLHVKELQRQGITTLTQFATVDQPLKEKPSRGSRETFARIHAQAQVQLRGRQQQAPVYELLDLQPDRGLYRLPEPSPGDVFFDIEGARFVENGGLEYLLGWCVGESSDGSTPEYHSLWALDRDSELRAFNSFIDTVMSALQLHPDMHIYHYHHYEPSAIKRLMSRYGTREQQVDALLRGQRFVDLYAIARQSVRCSVERYSLKDLEPFFPFTREINLREASLARRRLEWGLEMGGVGLDSAAIAAEDRVTVEGYNREDTEATAALREWLEERRQEWIERGESIPRPEPVSGEASEQQQERQAEVQEVVDRLLDGVAGDGEARDEEQQARWLLAHMLDYHRREMNCAYWEFFRFQELDDEELLAERKVAAGLEFVEVVDPGKRGTPVKRYAFPEQEMDIEPGKKVSEIGNMNPKQKLGTVLAVDQVAGTIDIKHQQKAKDLLPRAVLSHTIVEQWTKHRPLLELARSVVASGVDGGGPYRAARDLLLKRPPRRKVAGGSLRQEREETLAAARRLVTELDDGVLPVQGPPGSGKTYTGARMIMDLARAGKRVGVTAVGHKVFRNLLEKVLEADEQEARNAGQEHRPPVRVAHKIPSGDEPEDGPVREVTSNGEALAALDEGYVVGGTAWLWSQDAAAANPVDYLFVDEAGQKALADVLAVGRAARNIVLLGDPQQLEQPQQGAHPEGTDVAALVHVLDGEPTIADDMGLFLDETWRLHPEICEYTSELFYRGRLKSREGLDRHVLSGPTSFAGSGLFLVPVEHEGNQASSPEEVEAVAAVVADLRREGVTWTDRKGETRSLGDEDILIVAPYNAQIAALKRRLPGMKIGTVDKFQGQQAPVVVYSMTSSSPEDAPRGLEFLYNPNRLNVATSRARCACVLVSSYRLFEPECRSPQQMRWANALCRYRELAKVVTSY